MSIRQYNNNYYLKISKTRHADKINMIKVRKKYFVIVNKQPWVGLPKELTARFHTQIIDDCP